MALFPPVLFVAVYAVLVVAHEVLNLIMPPLGGVFALGAWSWHLYWAYSAFEISRKASGASPSSVERLPFVIAPLAALLLGAIEVLGAASPARILSVPLGALSVCAALGAMWMTAAAIARAEFALERATSQRAFGTFILIFFLVFGIWSLVPRLEAIETAGYAKS